MFTVHSDLSELIYNVIQRKKKNQRFYVMYNQDNLGGSQK